MDSQKEQTKWYFIPAELEEIYEGPATNFYQILHIPLTASREQIRESYQYHMAQHFPILWHCPYEPVNKYPDLIRFLYWTLSALPETEMKDYVLPYKNFGNVMKAYTEECAKKQGVGFGIGGGFVAHKFEMILYAYIILSNSAHRGRHDIDVTLNAPVGKTFLLHSTSSSNASWKYRPTRVGTVENLNCFNQVRHLIMVKAYVPNVGVWVSEECRHHLKKGRMAVVNHPELAPPVDWRKEVLRWEFDMALGFVLVRREKRGYSTGWYGNLHAYAMEALTKLWLKDS